MSGEADAQGGGGGAAMPVVRLPRGFLDDIDIASPLLGCDTGAEMEVEANGGTLHVWHMWTLPIPNVPMGSMPPQSDDNAEIVDADGDSDVEPLPSVPCPLLWIWHGREIP